MAAATANRERRKRNLEGQKQMFITPTTSTTIYEGVIICANNAGAGALGADTAAFRTAGVAVKQTVTAAASPDKILIEWGHEEWFAVDSALNTAANASVFKNAVILDNQTLTNAATATNDIPFGMITEFEAYKGVNGAWVAVGIYASSVA